MPFVRLPAVVVLIAAVVLLTGALNFPPARPAPPAPMPEPDPAAVKTLDEALARLDSDRVAWLETTLWQKGRLDRLTYEVEGRYLAGPNGRFRLELTTRGGRAEAASIVVSDGSTLVQGRRVGEGPWTDLTREDLQAVRQVFKVAGAPLQACDRFLNQQSFGGVASFLRDLRSRTIWTRKQAVRRGGRAFIKLTGTWPETADQLSTGGLPRRCRIYLDAQTLWPHRIEWWGPTAHRAADAQLLQMEFRDPVLNQPPSTARLAREFYFPIPVEQAFDKTAEMVERARQFLAEQAAAR